MKWAGAALVAMLAFASPAYADDVDPWLEIPRAQLADLLAKAAERDALAKQVTALEATVEAQARQITAQRELIALQDQMLERQAKLTALADEGASVHEKRADRIEAGACKSVRTARMTGGAATGLAVGTAAFPGPGTLLGAAIGAAVGFLLPCP